MLFGLARRCARIRGFGTSERRVTGDSQRIRGTRGAARQRWDLPHQLHPQLLEPVLHTQHSCSAPPDMPRLRTMDPTPQVGTVADSAWNQAQPHPRLRYAIGLRLLFPHSDTELMFGSSPVASATDCRAAALAVVPLARARPQAWHFRYVPVTVPSLARRMFSVPSVSIHGPRRARRAPTRAAPPPRSHP